MRSQSQYAKNSISPINLRVLEDSKNAISAENSDCLCFEEDNDDCSEKIEYYILNM